MNPGGAAKTSSNPAVPAPDLFPSYNYSSQMPTSYMIPAPGRSLASLLPQLRRKFTPFIFSSGGQRKRPDRLPDAVDGPRSEHRRIFPAPA